MRDVITYEWVFEEIENAEGDIIDPQYCDTLKDALSVEPELDEPIRIDIALVRFEGNDFDGINHREYAYLKDGVLPDHFLDAMGSEGARVPKRFHAEATRAA